MKQERLLRHVFVECIPEAEQMEEQTLYVSMQFATVIHKCCCGCGKEVVTPLTPTDWKLIFNGKTVSLDPSIGNWSFECQSHYWIRDSTVKWAPPRSREEIEAGRAYDRAKKERYFSSVRRVTETTEKDTSKIAETGKVERNLKQKFKKLLSQLRR